MPPKTQAEFPYTIVFVEGDTDVLFYKRIKEKYFPKARCKLRNLEGNFNINQKVLDYASAYLESNPKTEFIVCICIDKDSRSLKAPIEMDVILKELSSYSNIKEINIRLFLAVQDIESWFFHDIEGIYKFLRFPKSKRKIRKFKPVENIES